MVIHFKNEALPISVAFRNNNNEPFPITKVWSPREPIPQSEQAQFPTLRENLDLNIDFVADSPEAFDPTATIKIQTSVFNDQNEQKELIFPLTNSFSPSQEAYSYQPNAEYPWRMGLYLFEIEYKSQKYVSGFYVKPLHMQLEQITGIHNYLDNKIERIIYDFISNNSSLLNQTDDNAAALWYMDYAKLVQENYETLSYALETISKRPSSKIVGTHRVQPVSIKQNAKSIRWSMSSKGLKEKAKAPAQSAFYNYTKVEEANTLDNQWIKNILLNWNKDLKKVSNLLKSHVQVVQADIQKEIDKQQDLETKIISFKGRRNLSKSLVYDLDTKIRISKENQEKQIVSLNLLNERTSAVYSINSRVNHILSSSFLSEVTRGKKKPVLKRHAYRTVQDLYDQTLLVEKEKGDKKQHTKLIKPTWRIYEYFCLLKVLDIMQKIGYQLMDGIPYNFMLLYHKNEIPESICFTLENSDSVLHIWYDYQLSLNPKEAKEKKDAFFSPWGNNRPDIRIDAFRKGENGELLLRDAVVLDAKFRKFSSLYTDEYLTKVQTQLYSYSGFRCCYDSKAPEGSQRVEKVICLYPSTKETEPYLERYDLEYIKLFPSLLDNERIVGEFELYELLRAWIGDLAKEKAEA
ncbi:DUF2357 domain-containing protein [Bacillus bombysepticus]|uniref:DUF2357 domain-containing protein n=1 Tax=Bacillus bombysepticus TaxID=658666 RepID=UPI00301B0E94